MATALANSPAGPIEQVPNLKKRQRAVYYRPMADEEGNVTWMPTHPLPSDALSRELYLSKGFRLKPPAADEHPSVDEEKVSLLAENARKQEEIDRLKAQLQQKPRSHRKRA